MVYADGSEEHWTYESTFNRMTSHTDQLGRLTTYKINETNGNLEKIRRVVGTAEAWTATVTDDLVYSFTYTNGTGVTAALPEGLLLTETDPLGRETEYLYDVDPESSSFGWLVTVTMAAGTAVAAATHYEYDTAGNVTAIVDPLGRRTEMAYDALDRLVMITGQDPDGPSNPLTAPVTSFTYDAIGRLLTAIDPLGHVTTYEFDDEEATQKITLPDPDGAGPLTAPETLLEFDFAGNLEKVTDPLDRIRLYAFDELNRPVEVTLPDPDGAGS